MNPLERPSATQVYNTLSKFCFNPHLMDKELPGRWHLGFQSIKIPFTRAKKQQFSVKLKYGDKDHTTRLTMMAEVSDEEYTWFVLQPSPPPITKPWTGIFQKPGG